MEFLLVSVLTMMSELFKRFLESFGYNDPYLDKESYLSSHLVVNDMDNVIAI